MAKTFNRSTPYINLREITEWLLQLIKDDQTNGKVTISADVLKDYLLAIRDHATTIENRNSRAVKALRQVLSDLEVTHG